MTQRRVWVAVAMAITAATAMSTTAHASLGDGGGVVPVPDNDEGNGGAGEEPPITWVESTGHHRTGGSDPTPDRADGSFDSDTAPGRDHDVVSHPDPPCYEEISEEIDTSDPDWYLQEPVPVIRYDPPLCVMPEACGAERVDDLYTAWVSAQPTRGAYHDFLEWLVPGITSTTVVVDVDPSIALPWHDLAEPPRPDSLPVLWWCTIDGGNYILSDSVYRTRLAWATTVEDEYPIDQVHDELHDTVVERIGFHPPDPAAIPPLEAGYTYVKFPMWYWLNDPTSEVSAYQLSDLGLIKVEMAAQLDHVTWHLGDHNLICALDDMSAYEPDRHDPFDDQPVCSYTFTTLDDFDLAVTMTYTVSERISTRDHATNSFPDTAWQPHPEHPTIDITTAIGTHQVHELHALVVNEEIDY